MVPKDWDSIPLGKISSVVTSGSRDWARYYSTFGSKFIRMTNLNRNGIDLLLNDLRYVSINSESNDGKRTSLQYGDILISITAELGKIGWVPKDFGEAYINQHTAMVRLDPAKAESKFIAYQLSSHRLNKIINSLNDAGAKAGLNLPTVKSIPVLLPPLPEQKKITKIISTWDKAITTNEKLLANSEQQKKALMQQLLTGKILFPTDTSAWRSFTLSEIFDFKKGRGLSKDMITSRGKNRCILYGELYTQYNEVIKNVVSRTDSNDGLPSKSGDVLLPCSTTTTGTDLAKAVALFEDGILLGGDINVLRPKISVDSAFLAYLLTHVKRNAIASKAQGITIIHLYGSDLKNLEVTIPEILREQQKISSVISIVDGEIEKLKQKLDCLK
ncbi:restriction endonuclease subunit S [Legionella pneumophila]|nr:restriction endonuclease subunit S [Legionella pneumophila]TIE09502.1 restriction endonuclease subunit S [Legionella pneumophila]